MIRLQPEAPLCMHTYARPRKTDRNPDVNAFNLFDTRAATFCFVVVLLFVNLSGAQAQEDDRKTKNYWDYNVDFNAQKAGITGFTYVTIKLRIAAINTLGTIMVTGEAKCQQNHEFYYKAKNKVYTGNADFSDDQRVWGLNESFFQKITVDDPTVKIRIAGPGFVRNATLKADGIGTFSAINYVSGFDDLKGEQRDLSKWKIYVDQVIDVDLNGESALINEIDAIEYKLKEEREKKDKVKTLVAEAEKLAAQNTIEGYKAAWNKYSDANRVQQSPDLEKKIEEMKKKIEELRQQAKDAEEAKRKAEEDKRIAEAREREERAQANKGETQNSGSGYSKTTGGTSGNSNSSGYGDNSNSGNGSGQQQSAEAQRLAHLPDLVQTNQGTYHQRQANGEFKQISQDEYYAAKTAEREQKKLEQQKKDQEEAAKQAQELADFNAKMKKQNDDYFKQIEETNRQIEQQTAKRMTNFQDAQALSEARQEVANLTHLDMSHSDIERMERDYQDQMAQLNQKLRETEELRQQEWKSRVAATNFTGAYANETAQLAESVGALVNSLGEEKRKREAREALERQRQEFLQKVENEKAAMRLSMRTQMMSQFAEYKFPSAKETELKSVFGFYIVYNKTDLSAERSTVYVSNIVEIGTYTDGSWPSQFHFDQVKANTRGGDADAFFFHSRGYVTLSQAQQMKDGLKSLFSKDGKVTEFTIDASINPKGSRMDFWESTPVMQN